MSLVSGTAILALEKFPKPPLTIDTDPSPCCWCFSMTSLVFVLGLRLHNRLNIPRQKTDDPISSFINKLPKSKPTSPFKILQLQNKWPKLCQLLAELDYYQHPTSSMQQYLDPEPGKALLRWIEPPPPPEPDQLSEL
ncbi:hypothetical protein BDA99DRAFT_606045 [Phascolomyces articulosus]|uniref:Uncharacterized protein n=1 Tax=Phascolomyces articulosus TaxID=60185 RepID=A0AAD5PE49_9FUNG|nr:hypothetical protein BDA99DRAFT_606045 [Phascolomyces articulosus]